MMDFKKGDLFRATLDCVVGLRWNSLTRGMTMTDAPKGTIAIVLDQMSPDFGGHIRCWSHELGEFFIIQRCIDAWELLTLS
jgi:hypothetical protein